MYNIVVATEWVIQSALFVLAWLWPIVLEGCEHQVWEITSSSINANSRPATVVVPSCIKIKHLAAIQNIRKFPSRKNKRTKYIYEPEGLGPSLLHFS